VSNEEAQIIVLLERDDNPVPLWVNWNKPQQSQGIVRLRPRFSVAGCPFFSVAGLPVLMVYKP
jgi:hypothetical protein